MRVLAQDIRVKSTGDEKIDPYSKDEIALIFAVLERDETYSHYYHFFRFCYLTGCRPSEAIGLKWEYVEMGKTILIKETFTNGVWKDCPKNGKARRIPINSQLNELLESVKLTEYNNLVFPAIVSKGVMKPKVLNKAWRAIQSKANVRYRTQYQLRHTCATNLIEAGVPPNHVSKVLGSLTSTILRYYVGQISTIHIPEF